MTAAEMRSLYPGNTVTGEDTYGERFLEYWAPDGKAFGRTSTGHTDEGTWEITHDGQFCSQWNTGSGRKQCYINLKKGDEYEAWSADGSRMRSKLKIRPGNLENLGPVP